MREQVVPAMELERPRDALVTRHALGAIVARAAGRIDLHRFLAMILREPGTVRVAAGPWNLEEGWWSAAPASRDYWDVELSGGGLYRVYRDRARDKWYADGMYD